MSTLTDAEAARHVAHTHPLTQQADEKPEDFVLRIVHAYDSVKDAFTLPTSPAPAGEWQKISDTAYLYFIDCVKHGEVCRGIEGEWLAVWHTRPLDKFKTVDEAKQRIERAASPTPPADEWQDGPYRHPQYGVIQHGMAADKWIVWNWKTPGWDKRDAALPTPPATQTAKREGSKPCI